MTTSTTTIALQDYSSGLGLRVDTSDVVLASLDALAALETTPGLRGTRFTLTSSGATVRVLGDLQWVRTQILAALANASQFAFGTWLPVLTVEGTAVDSPDATGADNTTPPPGPATVTANWLYTRTGKAVHIAGRFVCVGRELTGGVICIGGLPFPLANPQSLAGAFTARDFDTGEQCGSHLEPPGGIVQHPDRIQLEIVPLHINRKIIINLSLLYFTT